MSGQMEASGRTQEVIALLLAGGVGERAARAGPKQLAVVGGMTVLEHAVAAFERHPRVNRIIVTMPSDLVEQAAALVPQASVVAGGITRQQSAVAGLEMIDDDNALVLIHDVARPFVSADVIDRCLAALQTHGAVSTVIDSSDTIYLVRAGDGSDELVDVPERAMLRRAQTPQGFRCEVIRDAHRLAVDAGSEVTDDCSVVLLHRPEVAIALVAGDERNIKLTTPEDFAGAQARLADGPLT